MAAHTHGNCNRCDSLSEESDTLKEVLGCDDEHGLVDQARDLVAERDKLRTKLAAVGAIVHNFAEDDGADPIVGKVQELRDCYDEVKAQLTEAQREMEKR